MGKRRNSRQLLADRNEGVGFYPDECGRVIHAVGSTYKQMRSWATAVDAARIARVKRGW